jgi:hypothetical protein
MLFDQAWGAQEHSFNVKSLLADSFLIVSLTEYRPSYSI